MTKGFPALRGALLATFLVAGSVASAEAQQQRSRILSEAHAPQFRYLSRLVGRLEIPVADVTPSQLRQSYNQGRSGGRTHNAIDIHAPRGTPVLAVTEGRILRLYQRGKGGNSIYHLDSDGRTRYYYAHLDRYASGLREGAFVRKGEVIGYVGDTGNAQPGDYHLHFSVAVLRDLSRWWEGENMDPYVLLRGSN
jgi:murein DD-endopeptidase MepM/ murein hydrolase activator NlpD